MKRPYSVATPDWERDVAAECALVDRARGGDEAAFEELADRVVPALYRFALSRLPGDRELARDIVQTTLCKTLGNLGSFRGEARFFTWLCACCRNEIGMHFRSRSRAPMAVELSEELVQRAMPGGRPSDVDGPERVLVRKEAATLVHMALDLLPLHYSRALRLKYLDQLPVKSIADRLDLGPKATESLLTRARGAFRSAFAVVSEDESRDREPRPASVSRSSDRGKESSRP